MPTVLPYIIIKYEKKSAISEDNSGPVQPGCGPSGGRLPRII